MDLLRECALKTGGMLLPGGGKKEEKFWLVNYPKKYFGDFMFLLTLPSEVSIEIYYGSKHPFIGWRSTIYGKWEPIHSVIYSRDIQENAECTISLRIIEK